MEAQIEAPNQHISKRTSWFADNLRWQVELDYMSAAIMSAADPLQSSADLLTARPRDPIVWLLRLQLVEALDIDDLEKELDLVGKLAEVDLRYYWKYRRSILEKIGTTASRKELDFTKKVILNDAKNYYAWSHRQWILKVKKNLLDLDEELGFCNKILRKDVFNAFAWNQRLFVVRCTTKGWQAPALKHWETVYAIEAIQCQPDNEYPWIYLRCLHYENISYLFDDYFDFYTYVLEEGISCVEALNERDVLKSQSDRNIYLLMNRRGCVHCLNLILEFLHRGGEPETALVEAINHTLGFLKQKDMVKVIKYTDIVDSSSPLILKVQSIIRSLDRKADWRGFLNKSLHAEQNTAGFLGRITDIEDLVNESRTSP